MGRTTFEPALGSDRWPWPDMDAFVLASHRPSGTPDDAVVDSGLTQESAQALPEGAVYACA